jgi:hypothetical protein
MITRRKVFGWISGLAAGLGLGTVAHAADPLAPWRPTNEQLDRYRRLRKQRDLLLPGIYGLKSADKPVLGRTVDILPVGMWDDVLTFHSYNGYDREDRYFHAPLERLETVRGEVWEEMKVALLPPKARNYVEQVRDQANELAKAFNEKHPKIEFYAWADSITENAVLRAYHIDEHYSAAYAITRKCMREETDLGAEITETWTALAAAMTNKPVPADWYVEQKPRTITKYA